MSGVTISVGVSGMIFKSIELDCCMLWYTVARDKDRQNKHVAQRHVRVLRTVVHNN